jgi:hypothetical protein
MFGLKKFLIGGLLAIAFATLLAYVYKEISYSTSMPTSPLPETGRLKPLSVNHGVIVYVTEAEYRRSHLIDHLFFYFGVWCGVGAGLLNYRYNAFPPS